MDVPRRRMCRYDQAFLELLVGDFALAGIEPISEGDDRLERTPDGRLLVLGVWQCAVCGYTELVDAGP